MPKSTSPVIVVVQARKPGPNSSRSATGSYSFGTVARKRLLKSIDSNSTLRAKRWVTTSVPSIDSTLKAGTTLARSGMWALARIALGSTALPKRPPASFSSASQEAPQKPSTSWPVRRLVPPTQSATGASLGLIPPTGS